MKLDSLIGNVVWCVDRRRAGVVVVIIPGDERAIAARPGFYVDHSRWAEVSPGEFLFACPLQLYGLPCSFRQSRALHGGFAGVLAAVSRSRIGNDDAHVLLRKMKGLHEFIAHGKWTLRARPHRELVSVPFGYGSARLQRSMLDVCHGVSRFDLLLG